MRKVKENVGMGDEKSNTKGVFPHLILCLVRVLLTGGCLFLPVPHKRQHICATQGTVIGSDTGKPVAGAKVTVAAGRYTQETVTDSDGHFAVDGEQGWHMIAWIATPSSGSLLPTHIDFEDGCLHVVVISAAGYPKQSFWMGTPIAGYNYIYPLETHLPENESFSTRPRFPLGSDGKPLVSEAKEKWY